MDGVNGSVVSEFVLLGLSGSWETKVILTLTFSLLYLGIILGNLFIVFLVIADSHLHSPMYFLLANLSFNDIGASSTALPRMISDLLKEHRAISFQSCMIQTCFIHALGGTEMVLLITMAFDKYAVICKPLHYLTIMSPKTCVLLIVMSWWLHNHRTFFLLLLSYAFILVTVWKRSSGDLSKALGTLSAHITVVVLFYTPFFFIYMWPFPTSSVDKYMFIVDFAITPALNPVIYTLRNKDIKIAMQRLSKRGHHDRFC
ncbi:Olfactory receptor 4F21 [Sciurus carolinensis]|uniref:Olfactory receptor 4F21 n=1 Tax=Sciurus carolinensis TaxID=30640 RepID=A0AA41T6A7_SCICA|nr:Olfactory receptor 4F21 [Sciurus carolinensis]